MEQLQQNYTVMLRLLDSHANLVHVLNDQA